jgi:DNA polymerase III subunit gamma/tau
MNNNIQLYNKYRPTILSEVVGHTATIKDLQKRSKENSIPKVILLSGITGVGKTTLFRIISKNILCNDKDENGNSCNTCSICETIDSEKPNNFYFEENGSNLNIEKVRELVDQSEVKSFSKAKAKVFIIDEVQEMKKSQAALNNLLKPIEKEQKNIYFIFGTMSDKDVPNAVKNRCTTYKLKPHSFEDIAGQLYKICEAENIKVDNEDKANVLLTIAENSYGSLRQAISYLERVIYSELWTVNECIKELDIVSNSELIKSLNYLFTGDSKAFDLDFNKELVDKIRYTLGTAYKVKSGIEVPKWQLIQLQGFDKQIEVDLIKYALEKLFDLNKYPYLNQEIIDYTFVDIFNYTKSKNENIKQNTPVPRRR